MDFFVPYDQLGQANPGPWQNAAPQAGRQGSIVNALVFPAVQNEILNVQDEGGLTRDATSSSQLLQAIRSGRLNFFVDSGTADALVITPRTSFPNFGAGLPLTIWKNPQVGANATTTPKVTAGSLSMTLVKEDGSALAAGDLVAGGFFTARSDGTSLRVQGLRRSDAQPAAPPSYGVTQNLFLAKDGGNNFGLSFANGPADTRPQLADADRIILFDSVDGIEVTDTLARLASYCLSNIVSTNTFQQLVASPTLVVRTDGNDANDGLANSPARAFRTIAAATAVGVSKYNFATTSLTIQLGIPGTYACPASFPNVPGLVVIQGDPANQDAYILTSPGNQGSGCFNANGAMHVVGVQIQNTGNISANVTAGGGTQLTLFTTSIVGTTSNPNAQVLADYGGSITFAAGCKIQGSASAALQAIAGYIAVDASVALVGTPTFSTATVQATKGGQVAFFGGNISGAANGPRYNASDYGIIDTAASGANFIPGSTAGTATTGEYK